MSVGTVRRNACPLVTGEPLYLQITDHLRLILVLSHFVTVLL